MNRHQTENLRMLFYTLLHDGILIKDLVIEGTCIQIHTHSVSAYCRKTTLLFRRSGPSQAMFEYGWASTFLIKMQAFHSIALAHVLMYTGTLEKYTVYCRCRQSNFPLITIMQLWITIKYSEPLTELICHTASCFVIGCLDVSDGPSTHPSNLAVGLPDHVTLLVISKGRHRVVSCPQLCVCAFLFVFNKLREVDVWLARSHSLPAWSCWWIVGPSVCVCVSLCVCVCVHSYRLRDIRWVLWWIPRCQKLNST